MSPSTPNSSMLGSDSLNCENIIIEGPGDNTVRPPSPEMLAWFAKERERLAKLGFNLDGTPLKPANGQDAK